MSKFTIAFVATTLFAFVGAVDFMPANPVPQGATCGDSGTRVFSYPADLVTVATDSDIVFQLVWNSQVSASATEGGVRILFPASQLQEVTVSADAHAQVLDGFTNPRRLRASSDAKLFAMVTNNASTNLSLKVSSDANVAMISNIPLTDVSASSDAIVELEAPLVAEVSVSSDATVFFKGSIGNAQVSSDGKLTVQGNTHTAQISSDGRIRLYGSLTGGAELSSDAVLYAQTIDPAATIQARSDATVFAPTWESALTIP